MAGLANRFKPITLKPRDLLLDPNNPRYQGDFPDFVFVPYDQIAEPEHQDRAFQRLLADRFGVKQLAESIAQIGYLPIDRLVVSPYRDGKYLVIEGNRRLAAIRLIMEGKILGLPENLESLKELPALELEAPHELAMIEQWLIQGTRHVGGVKQWGPYQKAHAIQTLNREMGLTYDEAAAALGMKTTELRQSLRALRAYEALTEHPQFGRRAKVEKFSYFEELVKKPTLRSHFGWNNEEMRFDDPDKRDLLFLLIMGDGGGAPKIATGTQLRDIARILDVPEARASLEDPKQTLRRAFDLAAARERKTWISHLLVGLQQTTDDLLKVSGLVLTSKQRVLLREVQSAIEVLLQRR